MPAVVLLSGGLDSTTALALTEDVDAAVFVDYGQRHIRERAAAEAVARHYGVLLLVVDLCGYGPQVTSALTAGASLPAGLPADDPAQAATVVPGRNAVLLATAAGIAADRGADRIVAAMHADDAAIYPDCRPSFVRPLSDALRAAYGVHIDAPFLHTPRALVAQLAGRIEVPIGLTWSCYAGGADHCGTCGACAARRAALAAADLHDPTAYRDRAAA